MGSSDHIKQLLRSGQRAQALNLLSAAIKRNPGDLESWWLLSFAIEDRDRQIYAVRRVLELNPGNAQAERRLAQLDPLAGVTALRQELRQPKAAPQPALVRTSIRQMPESSAVFSTRSGRLWTGVLSLLFVVTIGAALLLNSAIQADAAEATIADLAAAPEELPDIVVVLPSETATTPPEPTTAPEQLAAAASPTPQPSPTEPPPTPTATVEPTEALPALDQFVQSVANGQGDQSVGVFVEDVFSYPIVQQPSNDPAWITSNHGEVTEFRIVRQQTGNEGLIAHNYLAGGQFYSLQVGDVAELVLGDGSVIEFEIFAIEDYQALSPNSPTSDFLSLETGAQLSASDLFYRVYGQNNMTLTFQTCINRNNISTWGRTFVIGEEL